MSSFNGPWSKDLDGLKKSVQSMPKEYRSSFSSASQDTLEKICDPGVLHVWETDADLDNLLQLTSVIAKLCDLGGEKEKCKNEGKMVIIAEEKSGRDNFKRVCELIEYLTNEDGKLHLQGTVCAFRGIAVVRGWNNALSSGGKEAEKTVERINTAIERVMKHGGIKRKKLIWHHGPVIHFLLHWINSTVPTLRNAVHAITITNALDLSNGIAPSTAGKPNTLPHLQRLEQYARNLDVPVVFLDPASQLITLPYLATYMYFFAYYIHTFLPPSLSRPHLHKAYDSIVTFAFRLRGANDALYDADVVKMVKAHLDAGTAKAWAKNCIDASNYTKKKCRAAAQEKEIHDAVQMADSPFALFTQTGTGPAAFSRLAVGPASSVPDSLYSAAPVQISFSDAKLRVSSSTNFYILIPSPTTSTSTSPNTTSTSSSSSAAANDHALEKSTSRIQGLMMGVLERVRQTKGMPSVSASERSAWKHVVKACSWAIQGCNKLPSGVDSKVKFVREKLTQGTWGYVVGAPGDGTVNAMNPGGGYTSPAARDYVAQRIMGEGYGPQQMVQGQPQLSPGQMMHPVVYPHGRQDVPPAAFQKSQPHAQTLGFHQNNPQTHAYAIPPLPYTHAMNYACPPPPQILHRQPVSKGYEQSVGLQSMGGPW